MSTSTQDRRYIQRESKAELEVVRSRGPHVWDAKGRKYIDFVMGWCVGNLGWGDAVIRSALTRRGTPEYVLPGQTYAPWVELAELLAEMTPGRLRKCIRTTGGTDSVEAAMQVAMLATGRSRFVSLEDAYHGNSIGALSLGASDNREKFPRLLPGCAKLSPPLDEAAADRLETLLRKRDVAAFIMEPIVCNLAALVPDDAFMRRARRLCTRYGTLFIADEVATGFGRTGRMFASEWFGLEPDILCMAKAISGGYGGLGCCMITDAVARKLDDFSFYSTYGWHPPAVSAALVNLRYLRDHEDELMENANSTGDYIRMRLMQMDLPRGAKVQGRGLAIGIELESERVAERIGEACRKRGLLVSVESDTINMFPPLTIDQRTAKRALDIFEASLPRR